MPFRLQILTNGWVAVEGDADKAPRKLAREWGVFRSMGQALKNMRAAGYI